MIILKANLIGASKKLNNDIKTRKYEKKKKYALYPLIFIVQKFSRG